MSDSSVTPQTWICMAGKRLALLPIVFCVAGCSLGGGDFEYGVQSQSMTPTLVPGNIVRGKRFDPGQESLKRYEIIAFHPPSRPAEVFVMRVLGLPGEKITIDRDSVMIDGRPVAANELPRFWQNKEWLHGWITSASVVEYQLMTNELFLVGDNLDRARDSRSWGPVRIESVIGVVRTIIPGMAGMFTNKVIQRTSSQTDSQPDGSIYLKESERVGH